MYFAPLQPSAQVTVDPPLREGPRRTLGPQGAIGGPFNGYPIEQRDSAELLKRDAAEAAKDYVKLGRHTPPRHRR